MAVVREGTCRPRVRVDDIARPGSVVLGGKRRVFSSKGWFGVPPSEGLYGGGVSKGLRLCFSGGPIVAMWKDDGLDAASILMEIVKRMLSVFGIADTLNKISGLAVYFEFYQTRSWRIYLPD